MRNERSGPSEAKKLKSMGVRRGVPDLFLAVPRGTFHGLFIEMKFGKGKLTGPQSLLLSLLEKQQYKAVCCHSWLEGRDVIEGYLNGNAG